MSRIRSIGDSHGGLLHGRGLGLASWCPRPHPLPLRPAEAGEVASPASEGMTEHVIFFVLEGFGQESLKSGAMPVLSSLVKDGAVTWSATAVAPARRLPTMASLVTGMPVAKHGITWNVFEFSRGYPRAPTVFDYLDLSGGRDSADFLYG